MARANTPATRRARWLTVMTGAVLLVGSVTATAAAAASPSTPSTAPSTAPSAGPSTAPSTAPSAAPSTGSRAATRSTGGPNSGNRRAIESTVCVTGPDGAPVDCPKRVPRSKMPPRMRNTTRMTSPPVNYAQLVDTRTWTTAGGNTFPGADVPFGMTQWSPDTMPDRSAGGGYSFGDTQLTGYSLTHISGPGCGAAGDVPILPMTGDLPSTDVNNATTSFTNDNEVAQAGYYSAQSNMPDTITSEFTATPHTAMGRFTFPATTQADFLVKLMDSQNTDTNETANIVSNTEIQGSDTSGDFCGESVNDGQRQQYTVNFDIVFDHPFTASQIVTSNGQPAAIFLTFDTTADQTIQAKVGTSYVSAANAKLDWQTENPGWDFDTIKQQAQDTWNKLLGEIAVSGGTVAQTQEFYSVLYKDFMQPNISSDVNGQYTGADMKTHTIGSNQQNQYGTYSGWDIYHSLSQLQAMLDPSAASDQAQSLLNYYDQDQILQQWGYLNLNNYVMVGDPAQSIIADYYAFGAHAFDTNEALHDMLAQATTVNDVRPGEALEQQYGYLPEDGTYGCCNPHGQVSTLLEYDTEDLALAQFARAVGDQQDAQMLEKRANNWENVFNPTNNLLNPRFENAAFEAGITPTTTDPYVEGDAYEYLWNTPNNYPALFNLFGGKAKAAAALRTFLSQPNGFGMFAQLTNEFGFGEQYALDYAGDPAGTQQAVNNIRNSMYPAGPNLVNNDDLGANSSTFVWEMLGMYPENSGSDTLVFNSPGFAHATITPPGQGTITINAPGASATKFYVSALKLNGAPYQKLWVPYSTLAKGAHLDWTLSTQPTSWGSAPKDAPPSYGQGTEPVVGYTSAPQLTVAPGGTGTVTVGAANATDQAQKAQVQVNAPSGLTATLAGRSTVVNVPPSGRGTIQLTVHADASAAQTFYTVPIRLTVGSQTLPPVALRVLVAQPGSLLSTFDNAGIADDNNPGGANFDGGGFSYSAQALAAQGAIAGQPLTVNGITYDWPLPAPGLPDNVIAAGQSVTVNAPQGTQQLGVLGATTNGPGEGVLTEHYADGSTARYFLGFSDWTLNAGRSAPAFGNAIAVQTTYRDCAACSSGRDGVNTDVLAASIPVDPTKALTSITLPSGSTSGHLHIFAIGTSTAAASGPVIDGLSPATASAGQQVTIRGTGFGANRGNGYVAFSDSGTNWGSPGNAAPFTVNSWSDTAITFTVPTPAGPNNVWRVWAGTQAAVTVVNDAGQTSSGTVLEITPTSDPTDYYDNTGISTDANEVCADLDGDGFSLSSDALAAGGVTAGGSVTAGGVAFTWPSSDPCTPDNILAAGQTILVNGTAGATTLGLLGTSTNGSSSGSVVINYTDGTSSTQPVAFTDWAGAATPPEINVVTTPYRNSTSGTPQQLAVSVTEVSVPVDSSKTVASVTLPSVGLNLRNPTMHIFAVGLGTSGV